MISYTSQIDPPGVVLNDIDLQYGDRVLFQKFSLSFAKDKWTALLGPSGIGKTSLLNIMAGVLPTMGSVTTGINSPLSTQIAYMAQDDLLLPWLTIHDNSLLMHRLKRCMNPNSMARVSELLKLVKLWEYRHLYPHELSGGMRQRTALVRTLMDDKPIVLMDEPFANLDTVTRYHLQTLARKILQNKTVIFITHDPAEAVRLADDIYILHGSPVKAMKAPPINGIAPREGQDADVIKVHKMLFEYLLEDHKT